MTAIVFVNCLYSSRRLSLCVLFRVTWFTVSGWSRLLPNCARILWILSTLYPVESQER